MLGRCCLAASSRCRASCCILGREYIERDLPLFKARYPYVDVRPQLRRGHHPYAEAEFGALLCRCSRGAGGAEAHSSA